MTMGDCNVRVLDTPQNGVVDYWVFRTEGKQVLIVEGLFEVLWKVSRLAEKAAFTV